MQKRIAFLICCVFALSIIATAQTGGDKPRPSPPASAQCKFADGKSIKVDYSSPRAKGRKIYGGLVPYGQVWRTGANAATTLKTDVNLTIGNANVPAGTYTLYSIPEEKKWTLIINKQTGQWGTAYDQGQDLARVEMKVSKNSSPTEQFTIGFDQTGDTSAVLKLDWADTIAKVDVKEQK